VTDPSNSPEKFGRTRDWATNALEGNQIADLGTFQDGLPVRLITTARRDLSMCGPDEDLADVVNRNAVNQFDHLPVVQSGRIVGVVELIPFMRGSAPSGKVQAHSVGLSEENLIGADASIISFLRDADRHSCRLVISRREITGLVSLSDLQRLPVRAALFAMVTYLEMTMAAVVRRESDNAEHWLARLSDERRTRIRGEIAKAKSGDAFVDSLLFTQFADKVTILKRSVSFLPVKSDFKKAMSRIEALRNNLAHSNDYAATRETAAGVCEAVRLVDEWIDRLSKRPVDSAA
jgi:hypothetical protein